MSNWWGRVLVIVAALIGASIALPDTPTAELSRFIPIALSSSAPAVADSLPGRAGSLDQVVDAPEGLVVEGWVSSDVDEVTLYVGPTVDPQRKETLLLARPDVAATGAGQFTGFRAIFPDVEMSDVRCIVFGGPMGATEMWSTADGCA